MTRATLATETGTPRLPATPDGAPLAIFPPMMVTSSQLRMGGLANRWWVKVLGYAICSVIAGLNAYLLWQTIGPMWVCAIAGAMLGFAGWVRFGWRRVGAEDAR